MGHTIYYKIAIHKWKEFREFIERVCRGLDCPVEISEELIVINSQCPLVEPLMIRKNCEGFAKTNLIEPSHSLYLLILYSASSFGSVLVWED